LKIIGAGCLLPVTLGEKLTLWPHPLLIRQRLMSEEMLAVH